MNNLVIDLWNDAMNHYRDEKRNDNRPGDRNRRRRGWGGRLFALGGFLLLAGGLSLGAWGNYSQQQDVMATARHERDSVPSLRVATVEASPATVSVTLPGTTAAFAAANIYARATGYIAKRNVDIGDRVKAGDLLAQLAVPELEDQISQNEATLDQLKAALDQAEANRTLAESTWGRDKPLVKNGWVVTAPRSAQLPPYRSGKGQHHSARRGQEVLPTFAESVSRKVARRLEKLGVKVVTDVMVETVDDEGR
jgi:multidrug resistance efflux pump